MMRMIGIAFGTPTEFERTQYGVADEIRFARIEQGEVVSLSSGRIVGPNYWRKWDIPLKERTELAEKILEEIKAYRPREITGFTLFYQASQYTRADGTVKEPGFQMSVRRKEEDGWDVKMITPEQASVIFRLLETSGHPDGPWTLVDNSRVDVRDSYIVPQSAIEGWPKEPRPEEPEYFGQAYEQPAKEGKKPELKDLLRRCESLVEALSGVVATLVAGEG